MLEFAIVFREMLEASLIVWIIISVLQREWHTKFLPTIIWGVCVAVWLSVLFAIGLSYLDSLVQSTAYEKLFEACMMYLAAFFLISMIVWMSHHRWVKEELQKKTRHAMGKNALWTLFAMIVFVITREWFETVLFLFGAGKVSGEATFSYVGFWMGIVCAWILWLGVYLRWRRIPIKRFFHATSMLLIFFAAWMVAYGTHEMEEFLTKQWVWNKTSITRVWNVFEPAQQITATTPQRLYSYNESKQTYYHILHDKWTIWTYMKWFFWYNSDPNWYELFAWLVVMWLWFYLVFGWKIGDQPQR